MAASGNAVTAADPRNYLHLQSQYPHTLLRCSGQDVGLPDGQMGNSEVGHLNIGSGRVVYQEITRISNAIHDSSFFANEEFLRAIENARKNNAAVHLMGLLSDGGVHSHLDHLYALLRLCKMKGIKKVYLHGYLDGRDVPPKSGLEYVRKIEAEMKLIGAGAIATLSGRFYGMDRDRRWDRVERTYNAMVLGEGYQTTDVMQTIARSYEEGITDEFVEPMVVIDKQGNPIGKVQDGDSLIFFNFRADRARQITRSFVDEDFAEFPRRAWPHIYYVCLTQYDVTLNAAVAFKPQNLDNTLGQVLAQHGLKQLRIAETEKYAHVTFFFNGGIEEPNEGEERILIPSPQVATYDLTPAMSAHEVTQRVIAELERDFYDVVIMNYANPDMVGHTGVFEAAVEAVKVVDECVGLVANKVLEKNGTVLITSDHGNCEMMVCPLTGGPYTAHTTDLVPFIVVGNKYLGKSLQDEGALKDIAPTMLDILGIPLPQEMTGRSLLQSQPALR